MDCSHQQGGLVELTTQLPSPSQHRWDSYAVLWDPLYSSTPVLNCAGNHELEQRGIGAVVNYTTQKCVGIGWSQAGQQRQGRVHVGMGWGAEGS